MKPRRKRILKIVLVIALAVVVFLVISIIKILTSLPDAYAVWGTGELVVAHLDEHGTMPTSWADLQPFWDDGYGMHARPGNIETLDELRERIDIPFTRLDELRVAAARGISPPDLITPKSGVSTRWQSGDADDMIINFLRTQND